MLSRLEEDQMLDLEVSGIIQGGLMSATMKAAVHLGPDCEKNMWRRSSLLHDRAIRSCRKLEYRFTQIPYFVLERCIHTLQPWKGGENNLNISLVPSIIKNYMESMENHLSSSGITAVELHREIQRIMTTRGIKPEELEDRIILHVDVQ